MLTFNANMDTVSFYIDGNVNPLITNVSVGLIPNIEFLEEKLERPNTPTIEKKAIHFAIAKAIVESFGYDRKINNEPTNSDKIAIDIKNFIKELVYRLASYLDVDVELLTSYAYSMFNNRFGTVYFNHVADPITGMRNLFSKEELLGILDQEELINKVKRNIKQSFIVSK